MWGNKKEIERLEKLINLKTKQIQTLADLVHDNMKRIKQLENKK